jgi:hypothetical protein
LGKTQNAKRTPTGPVLQPRSAQHILESCAEPRRVLFDMLGPGGEGLVGGAEVVCCGACVRRDEGIDLRVCVVRIYLRFINKVVSKLKVRKGATQ